MSQQTSDRLPILLWGDVVKGGKPVLRRTLAGERAHECMYAWVYLTDFLSLKRLLDQIEQLPEEVRCSVFREFDNLWKHVDRSQIDPHSQLVPSSFEPVVHALSLSHTSKQRQPRFVELGSTFFASIAKLRLASRVAESCLATPIEISPQWIGIDNSQFMHDVVHLLHGSQEVDLLDDYKNLETSGEFSVLLSRFVASYVFESSADYADYVAQHFSAVVVEDAYSTTQSDVRVHNHGQPEVFFSLPTVFQKLEENGFSFYILETYPDWPGDAAPCHVVRYLATKRELVTDEYVDMIEKLGFSFDPVQCRVKANEVLGRLNAKVSQEDWQKVQLNKLKNPVWGRTDTNNNEIAPSRIRRLADSLIQIFAPKRDYQDYILHGEQAELEIQRAASSEKCA